MTILRSLPGVGRIVLATLLSLRRLNPFAPTLSISLAAAATIAALARPARVPAFRFSLTFGLEVFFLGILMMATMMLATLRGCNPAGRRRGPLYLECSAVLVPSTAPRQECPRGRKALLMRSTIAEEARRCETPTIFAPGLLRPKGGSKIDESTFTPMGSIAT